MFLSVDKIADIMKKNEDAVKGDTLAETILYGSTDGFVKEWNINGEKVTLGIKKN